MQNLKETRKKPPSSRGIWALPEAAMEGVLVLIVA